MRQTVRSKVLLSILVGAVLVSFAGMATAGILYWTTWISEESGEPSWCFSDREAAVGFGCHGSNCDNVRLLCETLPFGFVMEGYRFTEWFSEETSELGLAIPHGWYGRDTENSHVCQFGWTAPGIMTGITCYGRFCDNINLECATPVKVQHGRRVAAAVTGCEWSDWLSEEQGSVDFGSNRYIMGAECNGDFCDNKRFYVCSLVDPSIRAIPLVD